MKDFNPEVSDALHFRSSVFIGPGENMKSGYSPLCNAYSCLDKSMSLVSTVVLPTHNDDTPLSPFADFGSPILLEAMLPKITAWEEDSNG